MTATAFSSVQSDIVGALMEAPAIAGGAVYANRHRPIQAGQAAAVIVHLEKTSAEERVLGALDWTTQLRIDCHARAAAGADPCEAVDALLAAAWQRLASIHAAQGSTISINLNPAIDWQVDELDTPVARASFYFCVCHRTPSSSLQPWP